MKITVQDLVVQFPQQPAPALDRVSLIVAAGEHVALLGASGSGKTTLLRSLVAAITPVSGVVEVDGLDVNAASAVQRNLRRRTGIIRQRDDLVTGLRAQTNAVLGTTGEWSFGDWLRVLCGRVPAPYRETLSALARAHGVENHLGSRVENLSGGQRQRIALIRALLPGPDLLLADEPTSGLDPVTGRAAVAALQGTSGVTVILSTHDMNVAQKFPRVIALQDGHVTFDGPTPDAERLAAIYEPVRARA